MAGGTPALIVLLRVVGVQEVSEEFVARGRFDAWAVLLVVEVGVPEAVVAE